MMRGSVLAPLALATPLRWAEQQRSHVDELLVEQGHLEKKAAAAATALLFRGPFSTAQQRQLSALAREELVHFERTLRLLDQRGVTFVAQAASGYAEALKKAVRRDEFTRRLLDELLVSAIIEARSHERMSLLAEALRGGEPAVAAFYHDLCEAEERHEQFYGELAAVVAPPEQVLARHHELLAHEAAVLRALPFAARLHSGWSEAMQDHGIGSGGG
jgi:tRNA 2-(methylsulfanyl)-N6-isopentenyladenosine37 hydroxylase